MTIRVQNGKAEATDARPLHDDKGEINGLPLQSGVIDPPMRWRLATLSRR